MTEYKKVPTNTTARVEGNPAGALLDAMVANKLGKPGDDILRMEKRGQQELLDSHVLPTQFLNGKREDFEALGFTFGPVVYTDPLFQAAVLPPGWSRVAGENSLWIQLVDERGIARVGVFYKAAYYDRNAHMHVIDVGGELATTVIYGDAPPTEESLAIADKFTDAELASFTSHLRKRAEEIALQDTLHDYDQMAIRNIEAATAILIRRAKR